MKREQLKKCNRLKLSLALAMLLGAAFAFSSSQAAWKPVTSDQAKADLDILWQTIRDVHPRPDHMVRHEKLEEQYNKIRDGLSTPLDPAAIYLRFAPLVAMLTDSHTILSFDLDPRALFFIPLDLVFVDEKPLIKRGYTDEAATLAGCELLSINGNSAAELMRRMVGLLAGENASMKRRSLETDIFKVYYHLLFPDEKNFIVCVRSADGREKQVLAKGLLPEAIREKRTKASQATSSIQLRLLNNKRLAIMTLKTFSDKKLKNFFKESFQQLRQDGTKQLLIDLRDNFGGDTGNAEELLSYLTEAPSALIPRMSVRASAAFKKQVKRRIPGLFRWLPLQNLDALGQKIWQAQEGTLVSLADGEALPAKSRQLVYRGRIALLINGHTLSAASLFANWIKVHKLAKVFGQESGYSSAGLFFEPLQFNLPNSGLSFMVASMALNDEEGQIYTCGEGVYPDQTLQPLIADEMAGTDSILEQTLKYFASEKEE